VRGFAKLNAKKMKTAELMITNDQSPYPLLSVIYLSTVPPAETDDRHYRADGRDCGRVHDA